MLNRELEGLLAAPFTQDGFTSLMREILPGWLPARAPVNLNGTERTFIVQATSLGTASDGDAGLDLDVLVVELASGHSVHSSRSAQRALLTRLLRQQQREAALAAFYCRDSGSWRLSFVHLTWQHGEDGKVKTEVLAPLRRYSFVVGRGEPVHTAMSQLLHLLELQRAPTLEDIEQTFSIDRVTKEFYQRIAILFSQLTGGQRKVGSKLVTYNPQLHLPSVSDPEILQRFAVRLIGRLLFAWFLTKKHSDNGVPLMPPELLSVQAVNDAENGRHSYYHDVLERVFFEVLNTPVRQRKQEYRGEPWSLVPFLSSGLFEAQNDDFYVLNETGQSQFHKNLGVPNHWFQDLLARFSEYNFTIDENLSVDVDLAIEPEMLGRVFENLLAEINPETGETARKGTGSYYTPRTIVEYMVDASLAAYLQSKTTLTVSQVEGLLSYDTDNVVLTGAQRDSVLDAFDQLRSLDPACGSGAFPMGILQKSLLVLGKVDPGSELWAERQLAHLPDAGLRNQLEEKLRAEEKDYVHKLGLVRNCIYGIDIQPIAVEVSKLRFLLSLMVDERVADALDNRGVLPLPNLELKFVCANTLLRAPTRHDGLFEEKENAFFNLLEAGAARYFYASNPDDRVSIRREIGSLIEEKVKKELDQIGALSLEKRTIGTSKIATATREDISVRSRDAAMWHSYTNLFLGLPVGFFDSRFFFPEVTNGFNVVIENPPYIEYRKIPAVYRSQLSGYRVLVPGQRPNLYQCFIERTRELLAPSGVACFINPIQLLSQDSAEECRRMILGQTRLVFIADYSSVSAFESAQTYPIVWMLSNTQLSNDSIELRVPSTLQDPHWDVSSIPLSVVLADSHRVIPTSGRQDIIETIEHSSTELGHLVDLFWGTSAAGYGKLKIQKDSYDRLSKERKTQYSPIVQTSDIKQYRVAWQQQYVPRSIYTDRTLREFGKKKLVIARVTRLPQCAFDTQGMAVGKATVITDSTMDLYYLLAILNSHVVAYWYSHKFQSTHMAGGYVRYDIPYLKRIPIRIVTTGDVARIANLARSLQSALDRNDDTSVAGEPADFLRRQIESAIHDIYGLSNNDRLDIEKWYSTDAEVERNCVDLS